MNLDIYCTRFCGMAAFVKSERTWGLDGSASSTNTRYRVYSRRCPSFWTLIREKVIWNHRSRLALFIGGVSLITPYICTTKRTCDKLCMRIARRHHRKLGNGNRDRTSHAASRPMNDCRQDPIQCTAVMPPSLLSSSPPFSIDS